MNVNISDVALFPGPPPFPWERRVKGEGPGMRLTSRAFGFAITWDSVSDLYTCMYMYVQVHVHVHVQYLSDVRYYAFCVRSACVHCLRRESHSFMCKTRTPLQLAKCKK